MTSITRTILAALLVAAFAAPAYSQKYSPETLTIEQVEQAVERARKALYEDPALQPNLQPIPDRVFRTNRYNVSQEIRHQIGNHALICWALLACGDSYQNPALGRRMHWVLSSDQSMTYDRGMRLAMLSQLPHDRWGDWVRRDVIWMLSAMTEKGNFDEGYTGTRSKDFGDNANGQYGALGLWVYEQSGYSLKKQVWQAMDKYWREAMIPTDGDEPAGWAIYSAEALKGGQRNLPASAIRVSGPMTAGAVAILFLTERYLHGDELVSLDNTVSPQLLKGVRWLDNNFNLDDKAEETDRYYYYWTIQRVGNATGYRSFNDVDWFRAITARMLNEQQADGTWQGDKGRLLSTGFAMLYLSEAYNPVAVGKLRFTGSLQNKTDEFAWNNRPHDIWNFTDYISDEYEYGTGWQIVEPTMPVYGLRETPVLWLSTDSAFEFSSEEIKNLREYLNTGGILVSNVDANNPEVNKSFQKLEEQLFPGRTLELIPRSHELYSIHQKVGAQTPIKMIDNGIRPLWLHFVKDIGGDLQRGDSARSDSFRILSNIYLYAVGLNPRRERFKETYVYKQRDGKKPVKAARVKYEGRYDPEPDALTQLHNLLANKFDVNLDVQTADAAALSGDTKVAFLTTMGEGAITDADAAALNKWVSEGGLLWIDAAGGSEKASKTAEAMLKKIAPNQLAAPIASDHPIISGFGLGDNTANNRWVSYRPFALRTMGPVNTPKLMAIEINGRIAIVYSSHDITCGLAGLEHWGIYGYSVEAARNLAVNSVLHAAKN